MSDTAPVIDPLLILLARAARGVLSPKEGDKLRQIVGEREARIRELEKQHQALKRAHVALADQAGKDQATIARVRAWADNDLSYPDRPELLWVINHPAQPTADQPAVHLAKGTNAEDCPACCAGPTPDYPWICPGPEATP